MDIITCTFDETTRVINLVAGNELVMSDRKIFLFQTTQEGVEHFDLVTMPIEIFATVLPKINFATNALFQVIKNKGALCLPEIFSSNIPFAKGDIVLILNMPI